MFVHLPVVCLQFCYSLICFLLFFWTSADARLLEEATEPICQKLGEWNTSNYLQCI